MAMKRSGGSIMNAPFRAHTVDFPALIAASSVGASNRFEVHELFVQASWRWPYVCKIESRMFTKVDCGHGMVSLSSCPIGPYVWEPQKFVALICLEILCYCPQTVPTEAEFGCDRLDSTRYGW